MNPERIPLQLRELPCWGVWKFVSNNKTNKPSKIPFRAADGATASTTNRDDWGTFEAALACYQRGRYSGLGFAFFPEDGLVGIDRDDCRNPETGVLEGWARQELLPTYAEVSPSGKGYKQIGMGVLPGTGAATKSGSQSEFYDGRPGRERYFTITGQVIETVPTEVRGISTEVLESYQRMLSFDLLQAFDRRGWLREKRDKKQLVRCPWAEEHTHGDDEAAIFKRRGRTGGYNFRCLHAHCTNRSAIDVYQLFGFVEGNEDDPRPTFVIDGDLHEKTQELFEILGELNDADPHEPLLYRYGNTFGRITRMTLDDKPAADLLSTDKLKSLLAENIRFQKVKQNAITAAYPPDAIIKNILAVAEPPPFPRIRRIVSAPVFAADGTLLTEPGFHPLAGVYYAPDPGLKLRPVRSGPSDEEICDALSIIKDELLGEFPFVDPADRAHAIALLLLFFARDLIQSDLPLHLILKPEVATGAGKLADSCMIPALGGRQAVLTDCNDEDEWRKRITAVLMAGPEAVLLDNVVKIDSHQMAALLTTGKWTDRVLGLSRMVELSAEMPWIATGNNPELGYDIVRRVCAIRLDAKMPDPTERKFKHELPAWAMENRPELIWAALTIVQNWIFRGRQPFSGRKIASFERWSTVMGGILEASGVDGFASNAATFRERHNVRSNAWNALVVEWWKRFQTSDVRAKNLWPIVEDLELEGELGLQRAKDPHVAFGIALRQQRGRQFRFDLDGLEHEVRLELSSRSRKYVLEEVGGLPCPKVSEKEGEEDARPF